MAEPFLGEIRLMSFNFPPKGWAFCNGQFLPVNQNQALFSLLGTMYGGNGQTNFALPNLRGRIPMHVGAGYGQGAQGGQTAVTLSQSQISHSHTVTIQPGASSGPGSAKAPQGNVWARTDRERPYAPAREAPGVLTGAVGQVTVTPVGVGQPHQNMPPYLALSFCIALQGIYPSQT